MQFTRKRFPKPMFDQVERAFLSETRPHLCSVAGGVEASKQSDASAARVSEALLIATQVVASRADVSASKRPLLADYSYELFGRMCPHGVALEPNRLEEFLTAEWGEPIRMKQLSEAPKSMLRKTGIVCFRGIPWRAAKNHVDLWNGERCLDQAHWEAADISFWPLKSAPGGGANAIDGVTAVAEAVIADWGKKAPPKAASLSEPPPADAPPTRAEVLKGLYEKAAVTKKEIDAVADAVAAEHGGTVAKAPLKSEKRVIEKADNDYEGDVTKVKDFARNTIVVESGKELAALESLKKTNPELGKVKGQIVVVDPAKDPCGYSGIKVLLPTSSGMPGEVQINSPHMIFAKEKPEDARRILGDAQYDAIASKPGMPEGGKGHVLYEEFRSTDDPEKAAKVAAESRAYYGAVRAAAGG